MIKKIVTVGGSPVDVDVKKGMFGFEPGTKVRVVKYVEKDDGDPKKVVVKESVVVFGVGDWPLGGTPKLWLDEGGGVYTYIDRSEEIERITSSTHVAHHSV